MNHAPSAIKAIASPARSRRIPRSPATRRPPVPTKVEIRSLGVTPAAIARATAAVRP